MEEIEDFCGIPSVALESWRQFDRKEQILSIIGNYDKKSQEVVRNYLKVFELDDEKYIPAKKWIAINTKDCFTEKEIGIRNKLCKKRIPGKYSWFVKKFRKYLEIQGFATRFGLDSFLQEGLDIDTYLRGKAIIDAGAFIGDSSMVFCQTNCQVVYAFEADKKNAKILKENSKHESFCNKCIVFDKGLSNTNQSAYFTRSRSINPNVRETCVKTSSSSSIKLMRLDSLMLNDVGFVKLDIEGGEENALEGMQDTIIRCRPAISCALYHSPQQLINILKFGLSLEKYGYKIFVRRVQYESPACEIYLQAFVPISNKNEK